MAKKAWTVTLEDGAHTVELEHGVFSGSRAIHVDGTRLPLPPGEDRKVIDTGSRHPFMIGTHPCTVVIETNGAVFFYDLEVDGVSIKKGKNLGPNERALQQSAEDNERQLPNAIVFLVTGIGGLLINGYMASNGKAWPILSTLSPILLVMGIYQLIFKDDLAHLTRPIPGRIWIMVLIGALAGFLNWYLRQNW